MSNKTCMAAKLGVASVSLLIALSVYVFARPSPPNLIAGLNWRSDWLAGYSAYLYSAPSLFYTLAIGLCIGVCASSRGAALRHCAFWTGLAACLELTQAPIIAVRLADWLEPVLAASAWLAIGPYWQQGVFDPLDLVATFAGGALAILFLTRFSTGQADEGED